MSILLEALLPLPGNLEEHWIVFYSLHELFALICLLVRVSFVACSVFIVLKFGTKHELDVFHTYSGNLDGVVSILGRCEQVQRSHYIHSRSRERSKTTCGPYL